MSSFQLRSSGEQLEEAEATVNAYSKEISFRKQKLTQCDRKLDELKEQKVTCMSRFFIYIIRNNSRINVSCACKFSVLIFTYTIYVIIICFRRQGQALDQPEYTNLYKTRKR